MAENDLGLYRPRDLAKIWGTALGQLVKLWRMAPTALMALSSGEQRIVQSNQFSVPSADGQVPHLTVRGLAGQTFHQQLDNRAVVFTRTGSGPGTVMLESSIDPRFQNDPTGQPIPGDTYTGQVVDENGTVVATVRLDAGS